MRYAIPFLMFLFVSTAYGQTDPRILQQIEERTREIEARIARNQMEIDRLNRNIERVRAQRVEVYSPRGMEAYPPEQWQAMIDAGEDRVRDEHAKFRSPLGNEADMQRRLTASYFAQKMVRAEADNDYLTRTGWGSQARYRDDPVVGFGNAITNFDVQQMYPNGRAEYMSTRQYAELTRQLGRAPGPWFGQATASAQAEGRTAGVSDKVLHGMTGEQRQEASYQQSEAQKQYAYNILHQQAYQEMLNRKDRLEDRRNSYSYWYWYYRTPEFHHYHPWRW